MSSTVPDSEHKISSSDSSVSKMSSANETPGYKGLRTAIVLYTMHGHIGSREFMNPIAFLSQLLADVCPNNLQSQNP